MKSLTCKTCGSNQFKENKRQYICIYCNTIIQKKSTTPNKRIALIIALLFTITLLLILSYSILFNVKEDLGVLSNQQNISTSHSISKPTQIEIDLYSQKNPFSNLILKVEKELGSNIEQHELEQALSEYHMLERNKAFYIALTFDRNYAFGIASNGSSIQVAENEAKNACIESKNLKGIKDECIPFALNDKISSYLIENDRP